MRRPAPPRTRDYYDWLEASPTERKARLEEYEDKKKSARSVISRQTFDTASAQGKSGQDTRRNTPGLWGYHIQIKRLKLGVILLAERGVSYV